MPLFNTSLLTGVDVSGSLLISAESKDMAEAEARLMHSRAQVRWTFRSQPIGAYIGSLNHVWAIADEPGVFQVSLTARISISAFTVIEAAYTQDALDEADRRNKNSTLPWKFGNISLVYNGPYEKIWTIPA